MLKRILIGIRNEKNGTQSIGRSRGGLSTKIHATCDALGNPTGFHLTPGQAHDLEGADALMPVLVEAEAVLADKAYDADSRMLLPLAKHNVEAIIPPKANRICQRGYDHHTYQARHLIENFFARIKQFRAIATRYDKLDCTYLAGVFLTAVVVWLK